MGTTYRDRDRSGQLHSGKGKPDHYHPEREQYPDLCQQTKPAGPELIKTSDDGNVSGIAFTVEEDVPGIGYTLLGTYKTNAQGKLTVPRLKVGTTYRVTEVVPKRVTRRSRKVRLSQSRPRTMS